MYVRRLIYIDFKLYIGHTVDWESFYDITITRKKFDVEPPSIEPYLILVCLAKSSTPLIGVSILSTVRKAARFAVYEDIMINVKNHHILASIRIDGALKTIFTSKRMISVRLLSLAQSRLYRYLLG